MAYELPKLPYPASALEPHMSARTLELHHGKHHQAYYTALNGFIAETPLAGLPLDDVVRESANNASREGIFNNASQAWNHNLFWQMMKPKGGGRPEGDVAQAIDRSFGGFDAFREEFTKAGVGQFGSGWVWLVAEKGGLAIKKTPNGVNPLIVGGAPLLACDVWEHAYYLDYQNRRPDYLHAFLDHLANWDFAAQQLAKAGR